MGKNKIIIDSGVEQKIIHSQNLSDNEKQNFLRFIAYFTPEEKEELLLMI